MINYLALQPMQCATVAQPVEQLTRNEQVVRSNRISSSISNSPKVGFPSQFSGSFVCPARCTFPRKSALITPLFLLFSRKCESECESKKRPLAADDLRRGGAWPLFCSVVQRGCLITPASSAARTLHAESGIHSYGSDTHGFYQNCRFHPHFYR